MSDTLMESSDPWEPLRNSIRKQQETIIELQNRLSTLEKECADKAEVLRFRVAEINGNGGYKDMLKGFQFKIESLESKMSTLLKVCKGMAQLIEHALENDWTHFQESKAYEFKLAKKCLDDFRPLKDGV